MATRKALNLDRRVILETLEQKHEIASLWSLYGELLPARQRTFIDLHYNEDLSLSEIADTRQISRQAVHDAIRLGVRSLLRYEEALGLWSRREERAALLEGLAELRKLAGNAPLADTAPLREIVERMQTALAPDREV